MYIKIYVYIYVYTYLCIYLNILYLFNGMECFNLRSTRGKNNDIFT
jgi:hypothetical protein